MINVVNGLTLVHFILYCLESRPSLRLVLRRVLWNGFAIFLGLVIASRLFVLAHFPHQCLLAVLFGLLCFYKAQGLMERLMRSESLAIRLLFASFFLLTPLMALFYFENVAKIDLQWSVNLAEKYCKKVSFFNLLLQIYNV